MAVKVRQRIRIMSQRLANSLPGMISPRCWRSMVLTRSAAALANVCSRCFFSFALLLALLSDSRLGGLQDQR